MGHRTINEAASSANVTVYDVYNDQDVWIGTDREDRSMTSEINQSNIRAKLEQALGVNSTFIALTTPTVAQAVAQVKILSRENNALIRWCLNRFDSSEDS